MNNFNFPYPPFPPNNNNFIMDEINKLKERINYLENKIRLLENNNENNYLKKDDTYYMI